MIFTSFFFASIDISDESLQARIPPWAIDGENCLRAYQMQQTAALCGREELVDIQQEDEEKKHSLECPDGAV